LNYTRTTDSFVIISVGEAWRKCPHRNVVTPIKPWRYWSRW